VLDHFKIMKLMQAMKLVASKLIEIASSNIDLLVIKNFSVKGEDKSRGYKFD